MLGFLKRSAPITFDIGLPTAEDLDQVCAELEIVKPAIPSPDLKGYLLLTKCEADPTPIKPVWDGEGDHYPAWTRADIAWKLAMQEWISRQ